MGKTLGEVCLQPAEHLFDALIETRLDEPCGASPDLFETLSFLVHFLTQATQLGLDLMNRPCTLINPPKASLEVIPESTGQRFRCVG